MLSCVNLSRIIWITIPCVMSGMVARLSVCLLARRDPCCKQVFYVDWPLSCYSVKPFSVIQRSVSCIIVKGSHTCINSSFLTWKVSCIYIHIHVRKLASDSKYINLSFTICITEMTNRPTCTIPSTQHNYKLDAYNVTINTEQYISLILRIKIYNIYRLHTPITN